MRCRNLRERLPELLDADLAESETAALEQHLRSCPGCREEERRLRRALHALSEASASTVPDLWADFSARLGETVSCSESRELLAAFAADELQDARALSLEAHLQRCAGCAAELSAYQGAFSALATTATPPAIDLWPAFSARLAQEEVTRSPVAECWAGLWKSLRNPALARPALQLAALCLLVWGASRLLPLSGETSPSTPPGVAVAPIGTIVPPKVEIAAVPTVERTAPKRPQSRTEPAATPRRPNAATTTRPPRARQSARPAVVAQRPRPSLKKPAAKQVEAPPVLIARGDTALSGSATVFDGGGRVLTSLPAEISAPVPAAESAPAATAAPEPAPTELTVRKEMVRAFGLLARREDAAENLFGQETHGQ